MIETRSSFYYGHKVDSSNNELIINEGASDLTLTLATGNYSLTDFVSALRQLLDDEATLTYTVTLDRATRIITIEGSATFSLLTSSMLELIGFTSSKSGSTIYAGDIGSGSEYRPQFYLQDYQGFDNNKAYKDSTVVETASGIQEVVSLGTISEMQFNIAFINNETRAEGAPLEYSATGIEDANSFMEYAIGKGYIEFMPDRDDPDTYYKTFLLSTRFDRSGTGYQLSNLARRGLKLFHETGTLKFRKV